MAEIVNLNRRRKQNARAEKTRAGNANAARFGRSKAQRLHEEAQAEKVRRALDGHERERDT